MHCGIFEMVTMDEWRVVDCQEFEGVRERIFISLYLILRYIRDIFYGIEQGFFKIDLFNLSKKLNLNSGIIKKLYNQI